MSQTLQMLEDETDKTCFATPAVGKTTEAAFPGAGSLTGLLKSSPLQ